MLPKLHRKNVTIAALALLLVTAVACGQEATPTPIVITVAGTPVVVTATPGPTATATPVAQRGGSMVVAVSTDTGLRDGHQITAGTEMRVFYPVYDRLMEEEVDGTLTPVALESVDIGGDGSEYTLHIRPGMTFQDGTKVDADAVKWNFDRQMQADHPQGKGGLVPAGFICSLITWEVFVDSVTVVDPLTVKVDLNQVFGPFQVTFTLPCGNLVSPTAVKSDGEGFLKKPTGSGPFKLVEATLGVQTVYEKFDNYWKEGYPKLDGLTWVPMPEPQVRWAALKTGAIHLATELNAETVRTAMKDAKLNVTFPEARHFGAIWPNVGADGFEAFKDKRVRQAMAMAIDKNTLIKDIMDPIAYVAHGPMPTSNEWHNPNIKQWPYDTDQAKALLADAGYPNGFTFTLSIPSAGAGQIEPRSVATFIQGNLADVGITVNVNETEFATLYSSLIGGKADAYLYGITYWMSEPWNQITLIHQTGQFSNWGRYSNPEADKLMDQADRVVGFDLRKPIYDQVEAILAEEQANIYLYHEIYAMVARSEVQGNIGFTGNYAIYMDDVWLRQ